MSVLIDSGGTVEDSDKLSANVPIPYDRSVIAGVTVAVNDAYFIIRCNALEGQRGMIASAQPLCPFHADEEINNIDPLLNILN
ncbi:hypothetical protein [Sodalis sp. RH22]|uniref:hypothetical protein n=1 Tax=unclassified Sodalis (in: enterobacteria) TaxID=2636512 RepID=UPI0039B515F0